MGKHHYRKEVLMKRLRVAAVVLAVLAVLGTVTFLFTPPGHYADDAPPPSAASSDDASAYMLPLIPPPTPGMFPLPPGAGSTTGTTGTTTTGTTTGTTPPAGTCTAPAGMTKLADQDPDDSQKPWKRNGAPRVVINFNVSTLNTEWRGYVNNGISLWNQSACIETRVVTSCTGNCIPIFADDGGGDDGNFDAVESGGFTTGGEIHILKTLKTGTGGGERQNVTTHEMGHAIGLAHRSQTKVLMNGDTYGDVFNPDATDFKNLAFLYGRQS